MLYSSQASADYRLKWFISLHVLKDVMIGFLNVSVNGILTGQVFKLVVVFKIV